MEIKTESDLDLLEIKNFDFECAKLSKEIRERDHHDIIQWYNKEMENLTNHHDTSFLIVKLMCPDLCKMKEDFVLEHTKKLTLEDWTEKQDLIYFIHNLSFVQILYNNLDVLHSGQGMLLKVYALKIHMSNVSWELDFARYLLDHNMLTNDARRCASNIINIYTNSISLRCALAEYKGG